jgi:hypothetical protein
LAVGDNHLSQLVHLTVNGDDRGGFPESPLQVVIVQTQGVKIAVFAMHASERAPANISE